MRSEAGTLTGSAAVTQVETDAAAVLTSMGFTSSQVSTIQADQQALATAIAANTSTAASTSTSGSSTTSTSTSSSTTQATLQSVSAYLVGLPGISSFGMGGGFAIRGFGGGGGFGYGGGPGGGFMWR